MYRFLYCIRSLKSIFVDFALHNYFTQLHFTVHLSGLGMITYIIKLIKINHIYPVGMLLLFGCPYIMLVLEQKGCVIMDYISAPEAAKKWGISERRVQKLCEENRIPDVVRFSRMWLIPKDAKKPVDGRRKEKTNE